MVNKLDFGILGALEVDVDFNVNILTGSSGEMMGGLGGGPDVAAGAEVSIVTLPVVRGRTPSIVKKVFTVCTPAKPSLRWSPRRASPSIPGTATTPGSGKTWKRATLKLVDIEELRRIAEDITGVPKPIQCTDKIVCLVEFRDGTVIDVIRQVKRDER